MSIVGWKHWLFVLRAVGSCTMLAIVPFVVNGEIESGRGARAAHDHASAGLEQAPPSARGEARQGSRGNALPLDDEEVHAAHAHHHLDADNVIGRGAQVTLHDLPMVDHHGAERFFASEIVGKRIVAVTFVFTTCTTVCPVVSAIFAQVQERLGDALGRDVGLISISVDPVNDTPQRLADFASRLGAREGWLWLTGERPNVNTVLKGFGAFTPDFTDHPAMVVIGDARSGDWSRHYGFPAPEQIVARLEALAVARNESRGVDE